MPRLPLLLVPLHAAPARLAGIRPIPLPTRSALHHRDHADGPDDRRLQQDDRAQGIFGRTAGHDLFLARGRLEEGRLCACDRRCDRGAAAGAGAGHLQFAYNLRGSAYHDKGEYEIASADFEDAIRSNPSLVGEVYLATK